jgi:hypothetical protein
MQEHVYKYDGNAENHPEAHRPEEVELEVVVVVRNTESRHIKGERRYHHKENKDIPDVGMQQQGAGKMREQTNHHGDKARKNQEVSDKIHCLLFFI